MKRHILFPSREEMRLGKWSLTPNHDLQLTLQRGRSRRREESLTLVGKIISADANQLVFSAHRYEDEKLEEVRLVTLKGLWRADEQNRLTFAVAKGEGKEDLLTFEGAWEVGEHHQLLYRYKKRDPDAKRETEEFLSFHGIWEIREDEKLTYSLGFSGKSRFEFRTTLESPTLIAKLGEIRYQVGIRLQGRKDPLLREVALFGKWKLSRGFSLSFEVEYREGSHAMLFNTAYRVNEKDEIVFTLKNHKGNELGLEVVFTRSFFEGEGKAFLQFYHDAVESRLEGGVKIPF